MITSRKNPLILELQKLAKKPQQNCALAEGYHLVSELLRCMVHIEKIIHTEQTADSAEGGDILRQCIGRGVETIAMSEDCYQKFSLLKSPEGIAAVFEPLRCDTGSLFTADARLAVADGVQDPGNAGAICRVAEAAGMSGCIFLGGVNPLGGKFLRASMGSAFRLPCVRMEAEEFCSHCAANSVRIYSANGSDQSVDFNTVRYESPVAIVLGSEGAGVSQAIRNAATKRIRIPMQGRVESLNVAVAAGIIFYASV